MYSRQDFITEHTPYLYPQEQEAISAAAGGQAGHLPQVGQPLCFREIQTSVRLTPQIHAHSTHYRSDFFALNTPRFGLAGSPTEVK